MNLLAESSIGSSSAIKMTSTTSTVASNNPTEISYTAIMMSTTTSTQASQNPSEIPAPDFAAAPHHLSKYEQQIITAVDENRVNAAKLSEDDVIWIDSDTEDSMHSLVEDEESMVNAVKLSEDDVIWIDSDTEHSMYSLEVDVTTANWDAILCLRCRKILPGDAAELPYRNDYDCMYCCKWIFRSPEMTHDRTCPGQFVFRKLNLKCMCHA